MDNNEQALLNLANAKRLVEDAQITINLLIVENDELKGHLQDVELGGSVFVDTGGEEFTLHDAGSGEWVLQGDASAGTIVMDTPAVLEFSLWVLDRYNYIKSK